MDDAIWMVEWVRPDGGQAPVRSATCVPDLSVALSASLDGGTSFTSAVQLAYGWTRPLKLAFVYFGQITDFGTPPLTTAPFAATCTL